MHVGWKMYNQLWPTTIVKRNEDERDLKYRINFIAVNKNTSSGTENEYRLD